MAQSNLNDVTNATHVPLSIKQCKRLKKDLQNLIEFNQSFIARLNKSIGRVEKHVRCCLIAKTTGVSFAAVGTIMVVGGWIAGLVSDVPTYELSRTVPAVMTVAGTATAVAGGLTTAGTQIANGVLLEELFKEFDEINKFQSMTGFKDDDTLRKIEYLVNDVHRCKNVGQSGVIQRIKSGECDLNTIHESIQHQQVKIKLRTCRPHKIMRYCNGNIRSGTIKISAAAINVTNAVIAGGSAVFQSVLRSVACLGVFVFTLIDIVGLVKDFIQPSPLINELERIVGLYSNDIDFCQSSISLL